MSDTSTLSPRQTALAAVGILLAAAALLAVIFGTEPEARREGAVKRTPMLVAVQPTEAGTFRPQVEALGEVRPARDVVLEPRVAGEVIETAPAFDAGGFVRQGEVLLRLDPADYRAAVAQARAALLQAEAELALEEGRQAVARLERDQAGELSPAQEALVLRTPQRQTAQARVDAAQAVVERAELDLARTRITAPFDAQVLRRDVSVGSQVGPGDTLGRIVGLERYLIEATVPVAAVSHLALPGAATGHADHGVQEPDEQHPDEQHPDEQDRGVQIRDRAAWPEGVARQGRLVSVIGHLDGKTRMARVLVEVDDPLGRQARAQDPTSIPAAPPLLAGAWVQVRFAGAPLHQVVRLDRDLLRKDDTIWVYDDGELRITPVELLAQDPEHAYLAATDGLAAGTSVVSTHLATVTDGAPLRLEGESP